LNFVAVGTCSIQATQAPDPADGYLLMTGVTNITVDAKSTVAFDSPPTTALTATTTDAVLASGAQGDEGAISYRSITPAVCAVNALTGVLRFTTAGDCIIKATQAADATDGYAAGTVETSITVTSASTFGFVSPPTSALTTTTTDRVLAVGSLNDRGAVTYASNTSLVCRVGPTSGAVKYLVPGICVIIGTQAADASHGYRSEAAAIFIKVSSPRRTVIFEGNGSTRGSMRPETHNSRAKLTANGFKRTGYVFASWNTGRRGKGRRYAGGASYGFVANVTLYAQWTRSRVRPR